LADSAHASGQIEKQATALPRGLASNQFDGFCPNTELAYPKGSIASIFTLIYQTPSHIISCNPHKFYEISWGDIVLTFLAEESRALESGHDLAKVMLISGGARTSTWTD
jgi:hypothetical protein